MGRPWVILPTLVLSVVFVLLRRFYMASARDIKRLEGIAKSPVFSQLSTSLHGLTTIRAFSAQPLLRAEFDRIQDLHMSGWFTFISATRWFGLWLDWIVVVYLACVVYSFLLFGDDLLGGDVGLAISSCIMLTGMLQWGVRQSAGVENLMTSVERVMEYSKLEPEDLPTKPDCKPVAEWPQEGRVEGPESQDINHSARSSGVHWNLEKKHGPLLRARRCFPLESLGRSTSCRRSERFERRAVH